MSPASRPNIAHLVSPEIAPPTMAGSLLRLHGTLTQHDLWAALRNLMCDTIACSGLSLSISASGGARGVHTYRHRLPAPPRKPTAPAHPATSWLAQHVGAAVFRLSDVARSRELQGTPFQERVMRREGWDKQLTLVSWRGRTTVAMLQLCRGPEQADFSPRDVRTAEALQPHFDAAVARVLAHEDAVFRGGQLALLHDDAPVGLLLLDWDLRPLWCNLEGAHVCAVWNHGERRAESLRIRRAFRVPPPIAAACAELRRQRDTAGAKVQDGAHGPHTISDSAAGLHAEIRVHTVGGNATGRAAFHVRLDYRRPRADRNRALSPAAVALLGQLSPREREVAMRLREGLSTRAIATELRRSPLTIKTQVRTIFSKLDVHNRTRLAALLNR